MYEYAWTPGNLLPNPGPGPSSGYYVGILQYNSTLGLGYFLTTSYNNNPCSSNPYTSGYYDYYYYSGSGWGTSICWKHIWGHISSPYICPTLYYYFLEDNTGKWIGYSGSNYSAFITPDQQKNKTYYQYGVFWLYNWFQADNNMNIFFLMNGNIFNYSLALEQYKWNGGNAYAIPPNSPASTNTITGEPIFVQSYINAYNTAFNQETFSFNENYQVALNKYNRFTSSDVNSNFILGTFGYKETYNSNEGSFYIRKLIDNFNNYIGTPYLFVSVGSGGGSGFMYLNWIIVTYGVPYVVAIS
jgi:hypothetical protein